jgi:adenosylmethionine-8-amino-7-oxononanoate aminotransferase
VKGQTRLPRSSESRFWALAGLFRRPRDIGPPFRVVLQKYDILLVADEVVTGFGRLGSMFGSDHYGMKPDLITIAKGLTSAYAPLSGSIVGDKMWKVLEQGTDENGPIGHGWTYSAHPVGAAAGVANLKLLDDLNLIQNAGEVGAYLNTQMRAALGDHPHVGEVRGEGMLCAVEFVRDRAGRKLFDAADKVGPRVASALLGHGVIARAMPQGDILGFAPPFCLTQAEADEVVEKTAKAISEVLGLTVLSGNLPIYRAVESQTACCLAFWQIRTAKGLQPTGQRVLVLGECAAQIVQQQQTGSLLWLDQVRTMRSWLLSVCKKAMMGKRWSSKT